VQICILLFHFIKFYDAWDLYLEGIVREVFILSVVVFLYVLQYIDQSEEDKKLKALKVLNNLNTSLTVIFSVISIGALAIQIIMFC